MQSFILKKGLDIPISGVPRQVIETGGRVEHVALLGDDYAGLRPSMEVKVGDRVAAGQLLFTDKKNPRVNFTAPLGGEVVAINRGPRRRFESLVIRAAVDEQLSFAVEGKSGSAAAIKDILLESGLWAGIRTRPFGKVAAIDGKPSSLFVTAIDTRPLAADPALIIAEAAEEFRFGLKILQTLVPKIFLCAAAADLPGQELDGVITVRFQGPHPAGLPSTHIHLLDPVGPGGKRVWQIEYQEVIAVGHLFRTGRLPTTKTIALAGPKVKNPRLLRTRPGAAIDELCAQELREENLTGAKGEVRLLSGSVLDGRLASGNLKYLGRYHHQVSALAEDSGSGLFSWLWPGSDRFSLIPAFLSALTGYKAGGGRLAMNTAQWGGPRAIFPLGTYEQVVPLDFVVTALLQSVASGNTEKAVELGCLELIEEDLALCSFVCPGKNDFGPMLREILARIEEEGW